MKNLNNFLKYILFLSLIWFNQLAYSKNTVTLNDSLEIIDLSSQIIVYSNSKPLSINQFKNKLPELKASKLFNKNSYNWGIIHLYNSSKTEKSYFLSTNFKDSVLLYDFETGNEIGKTGLSFSINEISRNIQSGYIPIQLGANENKKLIIRLSKNFPPKNEVYFKLEPSINKAKFDKKAEIEAIALISIIITFLIFNFLVYIILRDKTYVYYLLYLLNLFLWTGNIWIAKWLNLDINIYFLQHYINNTFLIFFNIAYINFALSYFRNLKNSKWYKFFIIYQALYIIPFILQIINGHNYYLHIEDAILAFLSLGNIIFVLMFSINNYPKNKRTASLFLIAETPLILAGIFLGVEFLLIDTDISDKIGPLVFKIGIVLEILLFSFALGNRYREQKMLLIAQLEENALLKTQKFDEIQLITKQKNEELESLVEIRTSALQQSKIKLEKLNEEKNKIFSIISHDIRGPLSSLELMLELFMNGDLSELEFRNLVVGLKENLRNINISIQNLFIWAVSQMDGSVVNKSTFNLNTIIKEKIDFLNLPSKTKNINIKLNIEPETTVWADKSQIGIVLQNLINNAIKFTNYNGNIDISAYKQENNIFLILEDDGIGISKSKLDQFNKLEVIESSKGTIGEAGTGLGLTICREMIAKNDGKLIIESVEKAGTKVTIILASGHTN